jgi:hypothetical protein
MNSLRQLEDSNEHTSLSRDFQRVPAGYGGRLLDSAICRLGHAEADVGAQSKTELR